MKLSILMPVYNEADTVQTMIDRVRKVAFPCEVELVIVDEHLRAMIHDGASEIELERYARMRTPGIRDDGRAKVLAGVTTIEEVLKVTRED